MRQQHTIAPALLALLLAAGSAGAALAPMPPSYTPDRDAEFLRSSRFDLTGSYDRVDQLSLGCRFHYEQPVRLHPELDLRIGHAFGRDRWLYDAGLTQPIFDADVFEVGVRGYRITDTPDQHRMADTENSLATFFFREDWRDYHEAEGVALHTTVRPLRRFALTGRWRNEEHRSLSKTTDWGLFGGAKRMRGNPDVDEGTLRMASAEIVMDTRNSELNPSRGTLAIARQDWAGGELGGDFRFRRVTGDLRRYLKLSRGHFLDFRVSGGRLGGTGGGFADVPVQERFYLGGTGTLRATQFKSLTGDNMVLANAEMRVEIFRDFQAVAFVDMGDAWERATADMDLKTDAGIGFQDGDSTFRLNLARKIDGRANDDAIVVSARINRMF